MATLLSVNVGMPKDVAWQGRTVHTGIWKRPVDGPRMVRRLNIDGDGQGDLNGHGGEQRAVLVYQLESYRHWQDHFGRDDFEYGQFGENFTVDGLSDDEVCIGDRYRIGEAEFEVTQPRVTCFRVGMRLGRAANCLPCSSRTTGPGFYLRVITEGHVRGRGRDRPHQQGAARAQRRRRRRTAVPARPRRRAAACRRRHPGAQPGLAAVASTTCSTLPRTGPRRSRHRSGSSRAGQGFRRLRVQRPRPGELDGDVGVPDRRGRRRAADGPGPGSTSPLRDRGRGRSGRRYAATRCRRARDADSYRISVKREPHGVVSGYLHSQLRAGSILDVAAPRGEFVLTDDAESGAAGLGRHRRHPGAGHAAPARRRSRAPARCGGSTPPATRASTPSPTRRIGSSARCPTRTSGSSTPPPMPIRRRADPSCAVGRPAQPSPASGCPPTPPRTSAARSPFMDAMRDNLVALGIAPDASHTELFGALAAINPGVTDVGTGRTAPAAGPGRHRAADHLRAQRARRCAGRPGTARCSNWPTPATYRPGTRVGPGCATPA